MWYLKDGFVGGGGALPLSCYGAPRRYFHSIRRLFSQVAILAAAAACYLSFPPALLLQRDLIFSTRPT